MSESRAAAREAPSSTLSTSQKKSYFKAGVYERLFECEALPDGRALHAFSKAIAALLIGRAMQSRGYSCTVTDDEIAQRIGGLTRKTVRKYLAALVDAQLVRYDKGAGNKRRYDCLPLFERFGEERPSPQPVQKITQLTQKGKEYPADPVGKVYPPDGPTAPAAGQTAAADGSSVPTSITSSSITSSLLDTSSLREQLGVEHCRGFDNEIFAIDDYLTRWKLTLRAKRRLIKRHGIAGVMGAVGYVVAQQRQSRYGTIRNPVGLLHYALEHGASDDLAINVQTAKEEEKQVGHVYPAASASGGGLSRATWDWVDARIGGAFANLFRSRAQLELDHGVLKILCETRWDADNIASRKGLFKEAVGALFGSDVEVEIEIRPDHKSSP